MLSNTACYSPKIQEEQAEDWELRGFVKMDSENPILSPSPELSFYCPLNKREVSWEARNVLNPSAVVKDGKIFLLYRAQDMSGTSRIGLAISEDGIHFEKNQTPVFYPDNDASKSLEWHFAKNEMLVAGQDYFDGVEDPRIIETEEGQYLMTYTAYDGQTARLCFATSYDLLHWAKMGSVLSGPEFENTWSKSGAILCRQDGNKIVATKIEGHYWMYYGDTDLFMARSTDLHHWTPLIDDERGSRISVLHPRAGFFDSRLVEPGPYALIRNEGILLIYNASNAANFNDPSLPKFTYAAGQALFDRKAPFKLINRASDHFIHPDKEYEKVGEVNEVCFVEGMVYFNDKWFLYYGTADSKIAVAIRE
ncbi:MAG: hypothetical protein KDC80_04750 [Saprospiraceae bacterium]|nr:hypothetical protein [Saprospiraceae bacterium]